MRFCLRISILLAVCTLGSVLFLAIFLIETVDQEYHRQYESRQYFRLNTLRFDLENRLALGLSLAQIVQDPDNIEVLQRRDQEIVAIDVFDMNGKTLFSTDRGLTGSYVPVAWKGLANALDASFWRHGANDHEVAGQTLRNALQESVGAVALTTIGGVKHEDDGLFTNIDHEIAVLCLVLTCAAVLTASLITVRLNRRVRGFTQGLAGNATSHYGVADAQELGLYLRHYLDQSAQQLDRASQDMAGADRDI